MIKYVLINFIFSVTCLVGQTIEEKASLGNTIYLILLFAMCSSPLLLQRPIQGRYLLYSAFMGYVFLAFGIGQYADLFLDFFQSSIVQRKGLFSPGESITLIGIASFVCAYLATPVVIGGKPASIGKKNWRKNHVLLLGLVFWLLGAAVTIQFSFFVQDNTERLAALGGFAGVYINIKNFMMLGELMLAYYYIMWEEKKGAIILFSIMILNIGIGFIVNSKEIGFRLLTIYIVVILLMKGRVAVRTLIIGFLAAAIGFSFFANYRDFLGTQGLDTASGFEKLGDNVNVIVGDKLDLANSLGFGLNYLVTRLSLNGSTEMVASKAGITVPMRNGTTLTPVFYAFIPRFIMPNKPDGDIGILVNKEFEVSWAESVYISTGQLAEFYWNFSVPGVIAGMASIGVLFCFLSTRLDLSTHPTVVTLLLLIVTIYFLILRFEGGFSMYYTNWMRVMLLIIVIHLIMPKENLAEA